MSHKQKNQLGFSYIEISVVVIIIGILCAIMLAGFKPADKQTALRGAAYQVAGDIRKAQNMAMATVEYEGNMPCGYGVLFDSVSTTPDHYNIFVDNDCNGYYNTGDTFIDSIKLPEGIEISHVLPLDPYWVVFVSPDPTTFINGSPAPGGFLTVVLKIKDGGLFDCWSVTVETSGNIKVQ